MDRREALKLTAWILGIPIIGSQTFLSSCANPKIQNEPFDETYIELLNVLADAILPETQKSLGAKQANVGAFILFIVRDCYTEEETQIFLKGLEHLNYDSIEKHHKELINLDTKKLIQLLLKYDKEAQLMEKNSMPHFYTMLLQLTIWGYFISEPGATQALRYNPTPGHYIGCIPYSNNQPAWA